MSWLGLMLPVVLIELLIGVAIIIGALKMMRLQSYGWATTAAILALLPCSPACLLSLGMGIWSLVVLNRHQVKKGFQAQARLRAAQRASPAPSPSAARSEKTGTGPVSLPEPRLVQAPAESLIVVACVSLLTAIGVGLWLQFVPVASLLQPQTITTLQMMAVTHAGYALFMLAAGMLMRRLRARMLVLLIATVGGIAIPAMLALNVIMEWGRVPQWPVMIPMWLGMPAALWVTVSLFRDNVRRAFDTAAERRTMRVAEPGV